MTRPGTKGEGARTAGPLPLCLLVLVPLLFGVPGCGAAVGTFVRATGPVPLDETGPVEAVPDAAGGPSQRAIEPGERRSAEVPAPAGRRAAATFPYVPRRVPCDEVARIAREAARAAGVEPGLLVGVMRVESAFAANAISGASAVGLTQVLPWIGDKLECGDLFDPQSNASCGARVLARWLERFDGNLVSALSGYNAGHGMPTRAREERRIPKNFQYVEDVLRNRSRFLRRGCSAWQEPIAR